MDPFWMRAGKLVMIALLVAMITLSLTVALTAIVGPSSLAERVDRNAEITAKEAAAIECLLLTPAKDRNKTLLLYCQKTAQKRLHVPNPLDS